MTSTVSTTKKPWLVMIYIAADDVRQEDHHKDPPPPSIENSCRQFLENLRDLDIDNDAVYLVALYDANNIPGHSGNTVSDQSDRDIPDRSCVLERKPEKKWKDVSDELRHDPARCIFVPEKGKLDQEGIDSGHFLTLAAFVSWARDSHPAEHTALIIIGHGGGWAPTIARKLPPELPPNTSLGQADFSDIWLKNGVHSPGLNGVCVDESSGTAISTKELRKALRQGLDYHPNLQEDGVRETIDILFLDACLMGMVEVAYELQNHVEYLVAGENLMIATLAYQNCFGRTVLKKETTVEVLAKAFVDTYSPGSIAPWIISSINISGISNIDVPLNQLAINLREMIRTDDIVSQCVRSAYISAQKLDYRARKVILETRDGYVDLRDFLSHLKDEIKKLNIDGKLQAEIHMYTEKGKRNPDDKEVAHVLESLVDALHVQMKEFSTRRTSVLDTIEMIDGLIKQCAYTCLNPKSQSTDLRHALGLSIYLPLGEDDDRNNDRTTPQLKNKKHPVFYAEDLEFTLNANEWKDLLINTLIPKLGKTPVEMLPFHTPQLLLP